MSNAALARARRGDNEALRRVRELASVFRDRGENSRAEICDAAADEIELWANKAVSPTEQGEGSSGDEHAAALLAAIAVREGWAGAAYQEEVFSVRECAVDLIADFRAERAARKLAEERLAKARAGIDLALRAHLLDSGVTMAQIDAARADDPPEEKS